MGRGCVCSEYKRGKYFSYFPKHISVSTGSPTSEVSMQEVFSWPEHTGDTDRGKPLNIWCKQSQASASETATQKSPGPSVTINGAQLHCH